MHRSLDLIEGVHPVAHQALHLLIEFRELAGVEELHDADPINRDPLAQCAHVSSVQQYSRWLETCASRHLRRLPRTPFLESGDVTTLSITRACASR